MKRFADAGLEALPEHWQGRCLNFAALHDALLAAAERGAPLPLPRFTAAPNQCPKQTPTLLPSLRGNELHRRFAELLLGELDSAFAFLIEEKAASDIELAAMETLANHYRHSVRRAADGLDDLEHPPSHTRADGADATSLHAHMPLDVHQQGDPYVRAKLKNGLAKVHEARGHRVLFRMLNHDVCQRLVQLQAQLTEGQDATAEKITAKELSLFVMSHAFFTEVPTEGDADGVTQLYAALFCHGDTQVANMSLAFLSGEQHGARTGASFDLGLRLGAAATLLAWVLWDCLVDDDMGKDVWHDPAFKVYRGLGNLVLLVWCWGINVMVWRSVGIDYERFLKLAPTPTGVDPCGAIWSEGCDLSIAFLLSLICFWKALRGVFLQGVPPQLAHTFPISLFLYVLYRAAYPWHERRLIYTSIWDVMVAPMGTTQFKEGFVGDILTSVVRVLIDLVFSVGYFLSGVRGWYSKDLQLDRDSVQHNWYFSSVLVPAITVLPLWWRFLQNLQRSYEERTRWPHLGNACKYATAQTVALYGLFHADAKSNPAWLFGFVFATLYQFLWDIFMDWDIVRVRSGRVVLRENLLYRSKAFYLAVATINLCLRFFWTLTLIPDGKGEAWQASLQVRLSPILAGAEICRRCMWGFLRLENEHLHVYGTAIDDSLGAHDMATIPLDQLSPMSVGKDGGKGGSKVGHLDFGFFKVESSTASKSGLAVLVELSLLAGAVAMAGFIAAFVL